MRAALCLAVVLTLAASLASAQLDDPKLVALGGTMASDIYIKQMYIDAVRDAFAGRVYDAATVEQKMKVMASVISVNLEQLTKVRETALTETDKKALDGGLEIYKLLQGQANRMLDHGKANTPASRKALDDARAATWPKIQKMLGLND
jgi:hypothetical protein